MLRNHERLKPENRIEKMQESEFCINVKGHSENFSQKISCQMINPFKSDIGTLGKIILDQINKLIFLPCKLANRKTHRK